LTNTWNNTWQYIQSTIERKLQREAQEKYQNLDKKLNKLTQVQTKTPQQEHRFYPRVVNNTEISFSKCEIALLQKGLQVQPTQQTENWIQNLAPEAETTISKLPASDCDMYRKLIAKCINTLQQNDNPHSKHSMHSEAKTIKTIKTKLQNNNAVITSADKGNSIVILPIQQYDSKIQDFIQVNDFYTSTKNPTKTF
jgi:hypothetical protein